ncbi:hypothetical protein C8R44DRAFT_746392 [Mycena epipterygia]|nr:hypothetical protein C8R44DRAFT_746392 [Mycena epipterygia]
MAIFRKKLIRALCSAKSCNTHPIKFHDHSYRLETWNLSRHQEHTTATAILVVAVALPRRRRCVPPPATRFSLRSRSRILPPPPPPPVPPPPPLPPPRATPAPALHLVFCAIVVSIVDSVIIDDTPLRVYLGIGVPRASFRVDPIDLLSITSTVFVLSHSNISCDDGPGVPPPSPEARAYQPAYTTTHDTTKTLITIGRMSRYFGPVQTETTAFGGGPRRRERVAFARVELIGIDATSSYLNLSPLYGINSKLVRPLGLKLSPSCALLRFLQNVARGPASNILWTLLVETIVPQRRSILAILALSSNNMRWFKSYSTLCTVFEIQPGLVVSRLTFRFGSRAPIPPTLSSIFSGYNLIMAGTGIRPEGRLQCVDFKLESGLGLIRNIETTPLRTNPEP